MRHSFATHLIENGYDVITVQSLLGHKSPETTMIYVHMVSSKFIAVKSPWDDLQLSNGGEKVFYEDENLKERDLLSGENKDLYL